MSSVSTSPNGARSGYAEEKYHMFSYSPLRNDSGRVEGVFCAVSEDTERVISERRMASLGVLASELNGAECEGAVLRAAPRGLQTNPHDMPFTVTYLFDAAGASTRRAHGRSRRLGPPSCRSWARGRRTPSGPCWWA